MKNRRLQEDRHFQPPVEDKITTAGQFTKQFVRDQAGSVVDLKFSSTRTHNIEFVKQVAENAS